MSLIRRLFSDGAPRPDIERAIADSKLALEESRKTTKHIKSWADDIQQDTAKTLRLVDRGLGARHMHK